MAVNARRIDKNELRVRKGFDSQQAGPGGLWFGGYNRYFCPDKGIEQGGFSHIRPTDYGDKPTAMLLIRRSHKKKTFCRLVGRGLSGSKKNFDKTAAPDL